jgi:hypothetical protein
VYRGEDAKARCVEMQAFVKEMGEGGVSSSSEATLSAYSVSLSLRNRGREGCTASTIVDFAEGSNSNSY